MIRIEFDDSLRTGDELVDAQHSTLIEMFNELHAASTAGQGSDAVGPLLDRLHEYTVEHFTAEQRLMTRYRYPATDMLSHVEEHGALTQRVRELIVQYRESDFATVLPLATLLQDWLTRHIRQRDRLVVAHVRQARMAEVAG